MDKQLIKDKLFSMGIFTDNCYPKSSFIYDGDVCVGLYEREMKQDFYFFNKYDNKLYKWIYGSIERKYMLDQKTDKFMVPLHDCVTIWEDKPFVELPDLPFRDMTLRQYACIHLRIADSGLEWLDNIIRQTPDL